MDFSHLSFLPRGTCGEDHLIGNPDNFNLSTDSLCPSQSHHFLNLAFQPLRFTVVSSPLARFALLLLGWP
jgi:hypothetical protein